MVSASPVIPGLTWNPGSWVAGSQIAACLPVRQVWDDLAPALWYKIIMKEIHKRVGLTTKDKSLLAKKKEIMMSVAGAWKDSELDSNKLWNEIFKRRSRNYLCYI